MYIIVVQRLAPHRCDLMFSHQYPTTELVYGAAITGLSLWNNVPKLRISHPMSGLKIVRQTVFGVVDRYRARVGRYG